MSWAAKLVELAVLQTKVRFEWKADIRCHGPGDFDDCALDVTYNGMGLQMGKPCTGRNWGINTTLVTG